MTDVHLPSQFDPRGRHRGGAGGARHSWRSVGRVLGSMLSIGLLVAAGYFWYTFRNIDHGVQRLQVAVGAKPTSGEKDIDGQDMNILLVGNDDRSTMSNAEVKALHVGRDGGSLATDTMMIVHIPANGSRATLISLPRDTEVAIPDGNASPNKLNSPYATAYSETMQKGGDVAQARKAGANLLIKTITNLTGLTINHYVQVDLLGFYRLAEAIGGIPVNLCQSVDDRHSTNVAEGSDGGSGFHMSAGHHVLDALQSLEFVRQRHHLPNGDLDRVRRQQYFLTAAFRKVASVGILFKLNSLGDALKRSVFLDSGLDLVDLARQLNNLSANNIVGKTIPTTIQPDGSLTANPAKVQRFVAKLINPAPAPAATSTPSTTARSTPAGAGTTSNSSPKAAIDAKCIN